MAPRPQRQLKRQGNKLKIKEVFLLLTSILGIIAAWGFFTWQRLQILQLKNRMSEKLKIERVQKDINQKLIFQRAALLSLPNITSRAKELGMVGLEKDQLFILNGPGQERP